MHLVENKVFYNSGSINFHILWEDRMLFFENEKYRAEMVDLRHLDDVRDAIESLHQQKLFDDVFIQKTKCGFTFYSRTN